MSRLFKVLICVSLCALMLLAASCKKQPAVIEDTPVPATQNPTSTPEITPGPTPAVVDEDNNIPIEEASEFVDNIVDIFDDIILGERDYDFTYEVITGQNSYFTEAYFRKNIWLVNRSTSEMRDGVRSETYAPGIVILTFYPEETGVYFSVASGIAQAFSNLFSYVPDVREPLCEILLSDAFSDKRDSNMDLMNAWYDLIDKTQSNEKNLILTLDSDGCSSLFMLRRELLRNDETLSVLSDYMADSLGGAAESAAAEIDMLVNTLVSIPQFHECTITSTKQGVNAYTITAEGTDLNGVKSTATLTIRPGEKTIMAAAEEQVDLIEAFKAAAASVG